MIISERVFKIMEERGMSQIDFSRKTGISQSTISDWKRKKTNPNADKILTICKALEVSPYELLQESTMDINDYDIYYVNKNSEKYRFLLEYESLDLRSRERLRGYMEAMKNT